MARSFRMSGPVLVRSYDEIVSDFVDSQTALPHRRPEVLGFFKHMPPEFKEAVEATDALTPGLVEVWELLRSKWPPGMGVK